ncbi:hypothetical protein JCM3775_003352 [Rhodotorula graminis]
MAHAHDSSAGDPYAAYYQSHMDGSAAPPYPPHPHAGRPPAPLGAAAPHPGDQPPPQRQPPLVQHHHHAIAAPGPTPLYPPMQQALQHLAQHHPHHHQPPPAQSSSRDGPLAPHHDPAYPSDYHHQHHHQQQHPHQRAPSSSTPSMSNAPLPPPSAGGSAGTQASPHMPKARSAMACQLCRRQKMKCEGPEKAPCRRCRAAQVECVFEAPPAAPPRPRGGTGVTEAWVEGRLGQVEHRIELLEDTAAHSTSLVSGNGSAPTVSPETVTDHERRLAALEAQLYSLQITMARQVQIPQQQQHQPHPMYGPGPSSHPALEYSAPPTAHQQPHSYGSSNGAGGSHPYPSSSYHPSLASSAPPSHARFDSPTMPKHEPDRSHSSASARLGSGGSGSGAGGAAASSDAHREKRWKGESAGAGEGDFIARGLVSEEEAALCFDSYHLTFSSNGLEQPSDQNHLSFEETRRRSPLFLATVISIGARSLSRFDTFHTTYREAVRLAHDSFIPSATGDDDHRADPLATQRPSDSVLPAFARPGGHGLDDAHTNSILECRLPTLTLKALILLGLYHSMPELLVHSWMSGYRFIQPMVTQVFFAMTPEERNSPEARSLVNHTRVSLVAWLWLSFYTYTRGHHGAVWIGSDLLRRRLELIEQSTYAEATTDSVIRTNFEGVTIMLRMYEKISPGVKGSRASRELVFDTVREALADIDEWNASNFRMMETVTQWGDSADLKSIVPLHYFRIFILLYIFRDVPSDELDPSDPQVEAWARMAAEAAIVILRWGVESRIWMPFSVVGNYVHNVNVPAALWILGTLARLYPTLIDFNTVRPILHRLAKQCTVTAASAGATYREIVRARKTKHEVEDLDRVAFELCEADASAPGAVSADGRTSRAGMRDLPGGAPGHGHGQASSASSTAGDDTPGLFGHEVTASLNSLRLELNLWAKPLRGFEDDD